MKKSGQSTIFGKRREPHTIIIARGDDIRHFTIRPWMAAFVGSAAAAIAVGYLMATSYLVLRDDLIGATVARQARMQHAYEDRISALRAQVDRITSRQLLDQRLMETKVSELMERQSKLSERHGRLEPIFERADREGTPANPPVPARKPDERAEIVPVKGDRMAALGYVQADSAAKPFAFWATRDESAAAETQADHADRLFVSINQSLRTIENEQITKIASLADDAYQTADNIYGALRDAGLPVDAGIGKNAMGGPLIAIDKATAFDSKVRELDSALDTLDKVKRQAKRLPIANPVPGRSISSTFGVRKDPLIGTPALHSGMDFRAPPGFPARATASGTVISAGWNGGYGRMVEVDHGGGFTTRYAHLSRIDVKEGDEVVAGTVVGKVGSSGRSTGPHLHYEVRRNGDAIDPLRFIKVGKKLSQLM